MNRIQRISKFFRIVFQLSFILLPVILIISWVNAPNELNLFNGLIIINMIPRNYPILAPLTPTIKMLAFFVSMIPESIELFVLYFLIKLFKLYEKGDIFTLNNVQYIRNVGYTLLIGQLINPIYQGLISATLTWNNPHYSGMRYASVSFNGTNIGILLTALLVILISWIMAEGCQLREEQQLTI